MGHLSERKGIKDFPAVVRGVRERIPDARFSLLGTGIPAARVVPLFARDDRPHVRVVARFGTEELPRLLSDATVGVLPSYLEGFPLGVLEQLASGTPTVAYDAPGSRELVEPELLSPAGDPAALAAQVVKVLSLAEPAYAELAARSREVAERFRWRDIARDTLAVYESARLARQGP